MNVSSQRRWPDALRGHLQHGIADIDEHVDAAWARINHRLGRDRPCHIAAYRGFADAKGIEAMGRVHADCPEGGPKEDDAWWENLLNTYQRFATRELPFVPLRFRYGNDEHALSSDDEGYYQVEWGPASSPPAAAGTLWQNATVTLADGLMATPQPLLQILPEAKVGIISDIDDTVLHSGITDWKAAAQLTFLHNARTRKPLQGVAKLYQHLQGGLNPLFYVSSSPWNLYDLLDDFMELNAIPPGPVFLRDLGVDEGKFLKSPGHGHKLERAKTLIERMPQLRWILLGDSGQADAELYAEAAKVYGDRILAIYIRDVDPGQDSANDLKVDGFIQRVEGTSVPMLRVQDSLAIAEHARGLGLLDADAVASVAREVQRDQQRPTLGEAATTQAMGGDVAPDAGQAQAK